MNKISEYLKEAGIKFFCLKSKALLGSKAENWSLGIAYLPPIFARNLNLYADNGEVKLKGGESLEFYFANLTEEEVNDEHVEAMRHDIMTLGMRPGFPSVCVFLSRATIIKLLGLIEYESIHYWASSTVSDNTKLYEIYFDTHGMPRAKIIRTNEEIGLFLN